MRDKEKQLAEDKRKLDDQVADQVAAQLKAERARVIAEESRKAKLASAAELENKARELVELQEVLSANNEKLAEAQKAQAELIKKQRELDDAKRELELTVEKRVQEGLTDVRTQARKEAEDGGGKFRRSESEFWSIAGRTRHFPRATWKICLVWKFRDAVSEIRWGE